MEITPGIYEATLCDYSVTKTAKGDPQIALKFMLELPEGQKTMMKWLSLTEKAKKWSLETLAILGFNGELLSDVAKGPSSGCLDTTRKVNATVEMKLDSKGDSKPTLTWINAPGGGMGKAMAPDELTAVNFHIKEEMASLGITVKPKQEEPEIPF